MSDGSGTPLTPPFTTTPDTAVGGVHAPQRASPSTASKPNATIICDQMFMVPQQSAAQEQPAGEEEAQGWREARSCYCRRSTTEAEEHEVCYGGAWQTVGTDCRSNTIGRRSLPRHDRHRLRR
jgi:hypothetical protein